MGTPGNHDRLGRTPPPLSELRVRFAPSPTGSLHLGNARTALFNWLLAQKERQSGGRATFVLRLEDTDRERSTAASEASILADLQWLGLAWDEGPGIDGSPHAPYRQSEAGAIYAATIAHLQGNAAVYRCFCTRETLDADRAAQEAAKQTPQYVGRCRDLPAEQSDRRAAAGEAFVWRLKFPPAGTAIVFDDLVRGEVSFDAGSLGGDMVLVRSDGSPVFHFAVVVDDQRMQVTQVLRGEDHLTNTPKQVLLFRALGWTPPHYGHMAMILGPDKAKLSKRHGGTTVAHYRERGVLPEALFNYLCLLGWSPGDDSEVMSRDEIVARFSVERLIRSAAVFDEKKLLWLNGMHMRRLSPAAFADRAAVWLAAAAPALVAALGPRLGATLPALQAAIESFDQLPPLLAPFVAADLDDWATLAPVVAYPSFAPLAAALTQALDAAPSGGDARAAWLGERMDTWKAQGMASGKQLFQPLRLMITGRAHGPDLRQLFSAMPSELIYKRIVLLQQGIAGDHS